ncbi:hypothetical protein RKE25_22345 (plasmid) [Dyella sp. BiH032]|uniref:hypothetical protein n=1 Tax=Dyella sp. BiH032 TaxID=3075430 RepID=UPI002892C5A7|nr:hypothetical protein [Dyella sp. BiH032]WNL48473.1 hypothetical protein RKE25_22345 [Dyella sp. BiH032]
MSTENVKKKSLWSMMRTGDLRSCVKRGKRKIAIGAMWVVGFVLLNAWCANHPEQTIFAPFFHWLAAVAAIGFGGLQLSFWLGGLREIRGELATRSD